MNKGGSNYSRHFNAPQGSFFGQQQFPPNQGQPRSFSHQGNTYNYGGFSQSSNSLWPTIQQGKPRVVCQLCDKVGYKTKVFHSKPKPSSQQSRL